LRQIYRKLVADRVSGETRIVRLLNEAGALSSSQVLDVGCGFGIMLERLRELGVTATGVEINAHTVHAVRERGFTCYLPDDPELERAEWDAMIMSHIIEHFDYGRLAEMLDRYLSRLRVGGVLVIATPLASPAFFDDCDHVRPYPPQALAQLFGARDQQVQHQIAAQLEPIDFWFRRGPFQIRLARSLLLSGRGPRRQLVQVLNRMLGVLCDGSFGLLGRKNGWVGSYRRIA